MVDSTAEVVICGAGIAGIAAAYHLAVKHGIENVVLVDERAPLTLTSDKSTECYRNWWPGPGDAMVSLMNRSIDIMEELAHESGNFFHLNRRGYLFATADPARIENFERAAREAAALGAGPVRYHTGRPGDPAYEPAPAQGFENQPTGADLILDRALIREHFPYLAEGTVALVHARRAGWFSAQQLGMYLLERAREHGVRLVNARIEDVVVAGGRVQAVRLSTDSGPATVSTHSFVNAAGPFLEQVGQMVGVELPVFSELHIKIAFNDHLRVVPRDVPLLIWTDPTPLPWSDDERAMLAESEERRWLLEEFPPGVHARPEGGSESNILLILWTYDVDPVELIFPFETDPHYPEIALRGLSAMIPGLATYFDRAPRPAVDGGYYTKTQENRPLIGPLPVEGAYVIGALSGFGLMAACAAGELLAAHLTGSDLPHYAPAFSLERYRDPEYQKLLENWGDSGQRVPISSIWRSNFRDLIPQLIFTAPLGMLLAMLIQQHPLTVILLVPPVYMMYRALELTIELRRQTTSALMAFADSVDKRDPTTYQHSQRVAEMAQAVAEQMGLPPDEVETIYLSARLHDLGKVGISDAVLLKPGRLTNDEYEVIKQHPVISADIVESFPTFRIGHDVIRHHHERYDGTGYPDRVAGEDIPIGARIIAVVDTYDAMTTDRPYRRGMPREKVLQILMEERGKQLDADVVDAFLEVIGVTSPVLPIEEKGHRSPTNRAFSRKEKVAVPA